MLVGIGKQGYTGVNRPIMRCSHTVRTARTTRNRVLRGSMVVCDGRQARLVYLRGIPRATDSGQTRDNWYDSYIFYGVVCGSRIHPAFFAGRVIA